MIVRRVAVGKDLDLIEPLLHGFEPGAVTPLGSRVPGRLPAKIGGAGLGRPDLDPELGDRLPVSASITCRRMSIAGLRTMTASLSLAVSGTGSVGRYPSAPIENTTLSSGALSHSSGLERRSTCGTSTPLYLPKLGMRQQHPRSAALRIDDPASKLPASAVSRNSTGGASTSAEISRIAGW